MRSLIALTYNLPGLKHAKALFLLLIDELPKTDLLSLHQEEGTIYFCFVSDCFYNINNDGLRF